MIITDEDILTYCDGAMESEKAAKILEAAQQDSDLAYRIQVMEASRLPYKAAFAEQAIPEVPDALVNNLKHWVELQKSDDVSSATNEVAIESNRSPWFASRSFRAAAIAASLALCFVLGYNVAHHHYDSGVQEIQLAQRDQADWVRRVADYQTLYVENTVVGIVGGVEKATSMFSRLESSSDLRTGLPDLSDHGYTFVRAQELGYKGEPLVQLVYFKPGIAPLALCFMPSSGTDSADLQLGEHEGLSTANWIQDGQRFVIVGEESKTVMQNLYSDASEYWL